MRVWTTAGLLLHFCGSAAGQLSAPFICQWANGPGGCTGATASAHINATAFPPGAGVDWITITGEGNLGYTSLPPCTISQGGGSDAICSLAAGNAFGDIALDGFGHLVAGPSCTTNAPNGGLHNCGAAPGSSAPFACASCVTAVGSGYIAVPTVTLSIKNENANCGPTSILMIASKWNNTPAIGDLITQEDTSLVSNFTSYKAACNNNFVLGCNDGKGSGTSPEELEWLAKNVFRLPNSSAFHHWSADQLEQELNAGYPVVVEVGAYMKVKRGYRHYMLLLAMDSTHVSVNDPWMPTATTGANISYTRDAFLKAWAWDLEHTGICENAGVAIHSNGGPTAYTISTFAGRGIPGFSGDGEPATKAQLYQPWGLAFDVSSGTLYISDSNNVRIRAVSSSGTISTVAGSGFPRGTSGDDGPAIEAHLDFPIGLVIDTASNLYIADTPNSVRKVSNGIIATVAGNYSNNFVLGDEGPATSASLYQPNGLAFDTSGNLYIADTMDCRIRKVSAGGTITTIAGIGAGGYGTRGGFSGDGGLATSAALNQPTGVAVDGNGNVYIADFANNRIRKISNGIITTIAGTGTAGFSGEGVPAVSAQLFNPTSVVVDSMGNVFIADFQNSRVRKISASGIITTIAGNGTFGYSGDGSPATSAALNGPWGLALDGKGNVYVSDQSNNVIRLLTPSI